VLYYFLRHSVYNLCNLWLGDLIYAISSKVCTVARLKLLELSITFSEVTSDMTITYFAGTNIFILISLIL